MLVVAVEFEVAPAGHARFVAAAKELAAATRAESGCVFFEFWAHLDGEGRFHLFEGWQNTDALLSHRSEPHTDAFKAGLGDLGAEIVRVRRYSATETEV